jgi:hypothetical protein
MFHAFVLLQIFQSLDWEESISLHDTGIPWMFCQLYWCNDWQTLWPYLGIKSFYWITCSLLLWSTLSVVICWQAGWINRVELPVIHCLGLWHRLFEHCSFCKLLWHNFVCMCCKCGSILTKWMVAYLKAFVRVSPFLTTQDPPLASFQPRTTLLPRLLAQAILQVHAPQTVHCQGAQLPEMVHGPLRRRLIDECAVQGWFPNKRDLQAGWLELDPDQGRGRGERGFMVVSYVDNMLFNMCLLRVISHVPVL